MEFFSGYFFHSYYIKNPDFLGDFILSGKKYQKKISIFYVETKMEKKYSKNIQKKSKKKSKKKKIFKKIFQKFFSKGHPY